MITFDHFTPESGVPIYLQVVRYIQRGIVAGEIVDGDVVPSRRMLSALLGVNPNTIQKAYALLEEESLMASHPGAKSAMCLSEERIADLRRELLEGDVAAVVTNLKQMGLTKDQALELIQRFWE